MTYQQIIYNIVICANYKVSNCFRNMMYKNKYFNDSIDF